MGSITEFNQKALANLDGRDHEAEAWAYFKKRLAASAEIGAVTRILNGVDCKQNGIALCEVTDRPLSVARRLRHLAEIALALVNEEDELNAVDTLAEILCQDSNDRTFESQPVRVQTHYRKLAQSGWNAMQARLRGDR